MSKIVIRLALGVLLFALCFPAEAQQPTKIPRIGYLMEVPSANSARSEAFRQGLRELGYVEGKNIVIEWRSAEGKVDRLPALAAELVRLKVDIIVTVGAPAARAAKEATVYNSHCDDAGWRSCWQAGSSPALRDLAETSLDCQPLPRS